MAYIGREPTFGDLEKQTITGDNSATTFTLDFAVGDAAHILVISNGVVLTPGTGYSLNGAGTQIIYAAAPSSSQSHHHPYTEQALFSHGNIATLVYLRYGLATASIQLLINPTLL